MTRKLHALQVLLFSTALFSAQAALAQQPTSPDQEPAAETAGEGDAKAEGQPAVPTNEGLESPDNRNLEEIVVIGHPS